MEVRQVNVLLVEDDLRDFELMHAHLSRVPRIRVNVKRAATYQEGLSELKDNRHDLGLVDYRLGPDDGVNLVREAKGAGCRAPLIVLTGFGNETVDEEALRAGADDYLVKDQVDATLLSRSIRYALERRRLLDELDQARQRRQQEQELRVLEQLAVPGGMSVTAQAMGMAPIKESLPRVFDQMVQRFLQLLDEAMEERAFKVDHQTRAKLRNMGDQFGHLRATPADLIDVYRTAIGQKVRSLPLPRSQAVLEEGRTMVLGLMGFMASYYRSHCFRAPSGSSNE